MERSNFNMVAKTLYGLEDVLANELTALGAGEVTIGRRMVSFTGDQAMLYKANFCCRTALRILKPIAVFKAENANDVYQEVKNIDWNKYFTPDKTFAVDAVVFSESFAHSKFVAYRTKDAIADYFHEKYGKRPSVRVNNPDFYINIHISHNDCTVSLDSSGESLHKRGYRVSQGEAPLNEILAAGMILKTGWHGESHFVDPMCGSGTLLIEAAMIALNIAPGIFRKEFAFERWNDFDSELFDDVCNDDSAERAFDYKCYGSDISPSTIQKAKKNVKNTSLSKYIDLKTLPFQQFTEPPIPGILVTNPPYGERITTNDLNELYSMIGERLKHEFMGYDAWIISYKDVCFDQIGLRPKQQIKLMNGELECEYRCFEMFEGKNKEFKKRKHEAGFQKDWKRIETDDRQGYRRNKEKPFADHERRALFKKEERKYGAGRNTGNKLFSKEKKKFEKDGKPFDRNAKPFDRKVKSANRNANPYDRKTNSFDRTRKPFGKDGKPFGSNRKSFNSKRGGS